MLVCYLLNEKSRGKEEKRGVPDVIRDEVEKLLPPNYHV